MMHIGEQRRVVTQSCPSCRRELSATTAIGTGPIKRNKPKRGDATICAYCGALLIFTRGMFLRLANKAENRKLERNEAVQRFMMAKAAIDRDKPQ